MVTDDPLVLVFALGFCVLIGIWANNWGRNGWGWGITAAIITPLITAIALLIMGRATDNTPPSE